MADRNAQQTAPSTAWKRFVQSRFPSYFRGRITCPDCGGVGRVGRQIPGVPREVCIGSHPCDRCWPRNLDGTLKAWDDGTAGTIPEVPDGTA